MNGGRKFNPVTIWDEFGSGEIWRPRRPADRARLAARTFCA
jgi:hypothetical protein